MCAPDSSKFFGTPCICFTFTFLFLNVQSYPHCSSFQPHLCLMLLCFSVDTQFYSACSFLQPGVCLRRGSKVKIASDWYWLAKKHNSAHIMHCIELVGSPSGEPMFSLCRKWRKIDGHCKVT